MKPFLLLTTRARNAVAAHEYASYRTMTGLPAEHLVWRRLERSPSAPIGLDSCSGVIVAGSPFSVSDPPDDKSPVQVRVEATLSHLLDDVIARDTPFLGVCYGLGVLGRHDGAVVDDTFAEPLQAVAVHATTAGRADPLFRGLPDTFDAIVGHNESIARPPATWTVLASSASCPVQAVRVGANVYATQFHPELAADTVAERARGYADHGYFAPGRLDAVVSAIGTADLRASHAVLSRFVRRYAVVDAAS